MTLCLTMMKIAFWHFLGFVKCSKLGFLITCSSIYLFLIKLITFFHDKLCKRYCRAPHYPHLDLRWPERTFIFFFFDTEFTHSLHFNVMEKVGFFGAKQSRDLCLWTLKWQHFPPRPRHMAMLRGALLSFQSCVLFAFGPESFRRMKNSCGTLLVSPPLCALHGRVKGICREWCCVVDSKALNHWRMRRSQRGSIVTLSIVLEMAGGSGGGWESLSSHVFIMFSTKLFNLWT